MTNRKRSVEVSDVTTPEANRKRSALAPGATIPDPILDASHRGTRVTICTALQAHC
jgi:hypothetical protein